MRNAVVALCFAAALCSMCQAQRSAKDRVEQALSWLPADTETVVVANGPFTMPPFRQEGGQQQDQELSVAELREELEISVALVRFGAVGGLLQKYLNGQRIELAI